MDLLNEADLLAKVSLFSLKKRPELQRIAQLAQHHLFRPGDVIIQEGERDNRLFIALEGEVEVISCIHNSRSMSSALYHKFEYEKLVFSNLMSDGPFLQDDI